MNWRTFGFEKNKNFFEKLIDRQEWAQTYLFTGQEMIGKKTFAMDLADRFIFSGEGERLSAGVLNPDLYLLEGEGEIVIDQIRRLKHFVSLKPYQGRCKTAIIDDCQRLNKEAGNAFLKILEEPPPSSVIILISAFSSSVLPTIKSRCVEIKFAPHPLGPLSGFLESLGLNREQASWLAAFSNGRIGLAYRLKRDDAFKDIKRHLGDFNRLLKSDVFERLNFAEKIFNRAESENGNLAESNGPAFLLLLWMFYLRSRLSRRLKVDRHRILRQMTQTRHLLLQSQFNHRLAFENLLLNLN